MQVQVTGKHVDVGEALRSRVSDELTLSISKYFDRNGGGADVVVSREGPAFRVDCAVTLATGQQLTTQGLGDDAHLAFDAALEKMSKRIRRYKNRLVATVRRYQTGGERRLFSDRRPEPRGRGGRRPRSSSLPMIIAEPSGP